MVEEERKYQVEAPFAVPDLDARLPSAYRVVARPPADMRATYYDTADLRLARAGVSLRYRSGDDEAPWTVKLPSAAPGIRHEISRPGPARRPASAIPPDLAQLVTVYARGVAIEPVTTIRTARARWDVRDRDDVVLAEIADDSVAVYEDRRVVARFREIEVERKAGRRKLLNRIGGELLAAGAFEGGFTPKHVRALQLLPGFAETAGAPADLARPTGLDQDATTAEAVTEALRVDIARILDHDPLVRLRATIGRDDTAVHQMRVGVRRLRSTLRLYGPVFAAPRTFPGDVEAQSWSAELDAELRWLGGLLGEARDAEVIRARLGDIATADPICGLDPASVARIEADLAVRHEDARTALDAGLTSPRYLALVERLYVAARGVEFAGVARRRALVTLPRAVSRAWHRLADGRRGIDGATDLDPLAPDAHWHAVRIRAKRARYAVDAAAAVCGRPARDLADALAAVTDVLGAHQDAVIASDTWLAIAAADPDDHMLAVTAGRLIERERAAVRRARDAYPDAWERAAAEGLTSWLP